MQNYINCLFEIEQMPASLYFMHNTISNVLSGQTTMVGVPDNSMVNTKARICFHSEENDINLLFDREQMVAILDFTHNAMPKGIFWIYHYVGRTRKPHGRL